jgi:hypothetical protein
VQEKGLYIGRFGALNVLAFSAARRVGTLPEVLKLSLFVLRRLDSLSWNATWISTHPPRPINPWPKLEIQTIGQGDENAHVMGVPGAISMTCGSKALGKAHCRALALWVWIAAEAIT